MTGLLAALVVVAEGIAALLLVWLSPARTAAVSPSRWPGSGKLPLPGQAR